MQQKKSVSRNKEETNIPESELNKQMVIGDHIGLSSDQIKQNIQQMSICEEYKQQDIIQQDYGDEGQIQQSQENSDHILGDRDQSDSDPNVQKIVTILFMSHRIQAKVYFSDTLKSFLDRLRLILSTIDKQQNIGLYHLYFLKQEEDGEHGTLRNKCTEKALRKKKKNDDSQSHCNSIISVTDMIPTPLQAKHMISDLSHLIDNENYLIVYTTKIRFTLDITWGKPTTDEAKNDPKNTNNKKKSPSTADNKEPHKQSSKKDQKQVQFKVPYHETLLPGKTYFKVLRGTTTANRMLFCSYSDCIQQFSDTGNLKTHMRTHTNDRPFSCTFEGCGKSFITKGHLQTHILIHTGEKPYSCDICGKSYARSGRLKIHKRTHTGEKPFKCEVCGTCFTENGNLKTHMRIHTGEKPFRCEFKGCGKSFTTQGHLIDHKRKHTNTRPFECEICNQTFMRQSTLKLHMKRHQGAPKQQEKFICNHCQLQFSVQEDLDRHIEMHHLQKSKSNLQKQQSNQSHAKSSKSKTLCSPTKSNTSPHLKQVGSKRSSQTMNKPHLAVPRRSCNRNQNSKKSQVDSPDLENKCEILSDTNTENKTKKDTQVGSFGDLAINIVGEHGTNQDDNKPKKRQKVQKEHQQHESQQLFKQNVAVSANAGALKLDLKKVNEDVDKLEGIQIQQMHQNNQPLFLRQQASISTVSKFNIPNNRLIEQSRTTPLSRNIQYLGIKDENMVREGGLTPLNMDINQNGNDQSGLAAGGFISVKKTTSRFHPQGSLMDKSTTNKNQKIQFQQRGIPDCQASVSEKLSHYFNNFNASETPIQYVKNMGGDLSLLNNRFLLSFSQAQADANRNMLHTQQNQIAGNHSGLYIKTNQGINHLPDLKNYQPDSATPDQLKNIDEQSITQIKKQMTCQTMMNISQVDGGGTSMVRGGDNNQYHNLMFEQQNNQYRYSLFKDGAATTSNMLIQQAGCSQSMVDATDGVRTGRRADANIFPVTQIVGIQGQHHQGQLNQSKDKNSATSSVPTGSNKVQVDFTMLTQYRQQEFQSQIQDIDVKGLQNQTNQDQQPCQENLKQQKNDEATPNTIKADTQMDMQMIIQDTKMLQNDIRASNIMIGQAVDQTANNNESIGISSKSFQIIGSKPIQQQQFNDQLINEKNDDGGSTRNLNQPMRQINFLSTKQNQLNQLSFSQRMISMQPRDSRGMTGVNSSTNRLSKFFNTQGNSLQIAGTSKPGFESSSNYQSVSSPTKDQDQKRLSIKTINFRDQFQKNNNLERGGLSNTLIKQQLIEGNNTPDQTTSNANTSRNYQADNLYKIVQNQVTTISNQKSSPKFAKATTDKQKMSFENTNVRNSQNLNSQSFQKNMNDGESNLFKPQIISLGTFKQPGGAEITAGEVGSTRAHLQQAKCLIGQTLYGDHIKSKVRTPSSLITKSALIQAGNANIQLQHSFSKVVNEIQYSENRRIDVGGVQSTNHIGNNQESQTITQNTKGARNNISETLKQIQGQNHTFNKLDISNVDESNTNTIEQLQINAQNPQNNLQYSSNNIQDISPSKYGPAGSQYSNTNLLNGSNTNSYLVNNVDFASAAMQFSKQRAGQTNNPSATFTNQTLRAIQKVQGHNQGQQQQTTAGCAFMTPQSRRLTPINSKARMQATELLRLNMNTLQNNNSSVSYSNNPINYNSNNIQKNQTSKFIGSGQATQDIPESISQHSETAAVVVNNNGMTYGGNEGSLNQQQMQLQQTNPIIHVLTSSKSQSNHQTTENPLNKQNTLPKMSQYQLKQQNIGSSATVREPESADALKKGFISSTLSVQRSLQSPELQKVNNFEQAPQQFLQQHQQQNLQLMQQQHQYEIKSNV